MSGNILVPNLAWNWALISFNYRVDLIDLAMKHKPLNLGQGFPDFAPPKHVTDALAEVAMGDNILLQQYTRGYVILYC